MTVHDNSSPVAAAGGIYIDGGKSIIVENNKSYNNDYGIEVGCENNGNAPNDPSASDIIVRNNLIYSNKVAGIALGGYNYPSTGKVENTTIQNNTLFNNNTENSYNGELLVSYVEDATIVNNIFYTNNSDRVLIVSTYENSTLSLNYNLYYTPGGSNDIFIELDGTEYNEFSTYQAQSGQDVDSDFTNPIFVDASLSNPDLHLIESSPAINAGNPSFTSSNGETDIDGEQRIYDQIVDCGADEYNSGVLSTNDNTITESVFVYPNPTNGIINVRGITNFNYKIYSYNGQLIKANTSTDNTIDLSGQKSGLYIVMISNTSGSSVSQLKVIKK